MQFPIPSTGNSAVNILIIRVKFWCVVGSLHHTHTPLSSDERRTENGTKNRTVYQVTN